MLRVGIESNSRMKGREDEEDLKIAALNRKKKGFNLK